MTILNLSSPVGDWVSEHPRTSRIFEELHIDYCCGGRTPLEEACRERSLDPKDVEARLLESMGLFEDVPSEMWNTAPLKDLCDHIEQTHHAYLRTELPRLSKMVKKVAAVHGDRHQYLLQLEKVFEGFRAELETHMFKEEAVLFPAIRELESESGAAQFPFGSVANPIRVMEHEHDDAGQALAKMRELTNHYQPPEGACNTFRAMLDGLRELERDMHHHVHKENNILFPRAKELECPNVRA
jgi:regulator of cell morphogenesis and NO signaling